MATAAWDRNVRAGQWSKMTGAAQFEFDPAALDRTVIEQHTAEIWSGLAFDEDAKAALRRDGLAIDTMRMTGPNPFRFRKIASGKISLTAPRRSDAAGLVDLWQVYIWRRIREDLGG